MNRFGIPTGVFFLCASLPPVFGQPTNIRVSSTAISDPEEVTIAINPVNPMQLAAGSNLRYLYRSADGGQTWSTGQLPVGTWGDPCVLFDNDGTLYYAHLANLPAGYFIDRLIVHRSTNGGVSWKDSVEVGYQPPNRGQDKEWLAVDGTGSPFRGRVYMAWTEFDSDAKMIFLNLFSCSYLSFFCFVCGAHWKIALESPKRP